jgi:hypothetical protein
MHSPHGTANNGGEGGNSEVIREGFDDLGLIADCQIGEA